jgi:hypothetical protein
MKVRAELGASADTMIAERIEETMLRTTLVFVGVAIALSLGAAFGVRQIPM